MASWNPGANRIDELALPPHLRRRVAGRTSITSINSETIIREVARDQFVCGEQIAPGAAVYVSNNEIFNANINNPAVTFALQGGAAGASSEVDDFVVIEIPNANLAGNNYVYLKNKDENGVNVTTNLPEPVYGCYIQRLGYAVGAELLLPEIMLGERLI